MARFEALRRMLVERPDEDDAYLVLADYLQQAEDPRGELIVLEHRAQTQSDPEARAAARDFFRTHKEALVGPLAEVAPYLTGVRWHLGFVRQASLQIAHDLPTQLARRVVRTALDAPAMALIHRLSVVVGSDGLIDEQTHDLERTVLSAVCSSERASVRHLYVSGLGAGRVSVKLLSDALPNVETLSVACQRISFGGVKAWGVRFMMLFTSAIPVASFRAVDWRSLESLALMASIDGSLTELLEAVPALTSFSISTAPRSVEVIGSLFESGRAQRLERLRIDPTGAKEIEALGREARRFGALRRLEITRGHAELAGVFGAEVEIGHPVGGLESADDGVGVDYEELETP